MDAIYVIKVKGALNSTWSDWFDGFDISPQDGVTLLVGEVADQAALLGILGKLSDLRLPLLSVELIENESEI